MQELKDFIRDIPDFPKPGIVFKDISPMLKNPSALKKTIDFMAEKLTSLKPDVVLGIESRGFIFGGALAVATAKGFLPARKPGKLPYKTDQVSYDLEYGSNCLELHIDAVEPGQRVVIVDDLLATGGTASACAELIRRQKGIVAGHLFVVELSFLNGRTKLDPDPVYSILDY